MREILFRGKRKLDGAWVIGDLSQHKTGKKFIKLGGGSSTHSFEVDENTICQYTGMTDKNGNKIWENDIALIGGIDRAIVIFSEKHSGYILQPIGDFYFDSPMLADNVDIIDNIIGNIFDNPELIGEQNG